MPHKRPVGAEQLGIDFSSQTNEILAEIRSLESRLCDWHPSRAAGVIELLERILLCSRDRLTSQARVSSLAARISGRRAVSERTIRRWATDAERLGLLIVERRSAKWGGHRTNCWTIDRRRLRVLSSGLGMTRGGPGADMMSAPGADMMSALTLGREEVNELPPPSVPPQTTATGAPAGSARAPAGKWEEVVGRLKAMGMHDAPAACERAARRGVAPDFVTGLVAHYRSAPGAWGIGQLHFRIRSAVPGERIEDGWPLPAGPSGRRTPTPETRQADRDRLLYLRVRQLRQTGLTPEQAVARAELELAHEST